MKYKDEEIVLLRNHQKKKKFINSETGMYVGDELLMFYKKEIFPECTVVIPDGFDEIAAELVEKKYPSVNRPQVILTDESGTINFTFSEYKNSLETDTMADLIEQLKLVIRNMYPATFFMGDGMIEDQACYWTSFKSESLDGRLYNVLAVTSLKEKSILEMFNCPEADWMLWKPVMLEVLSSIHKEEKS